MLERSRRDSRAVAAQDHCHINFTDDESIPPKWREVLECRKCKRRVVEYIGDTILLVAPQLLKDNQWLYVAGSGEGQDGDRVWCTSIDCIEREVPELCCNAEEADTRVWLHAKFASSSRALVFSPDTDVYHIGLAAGMDFDQCEVIVQLSSVGRDLQLLHMNHLIEAIHYDPSLSTIPGCDLLGAIQMLYITTGYDFTSFFVGLGKVMFLKSFYACSEFISSGMDPSTPGVLACKDPESSGFLSFIRLVGATYFAKHRGAFLENSAASLYNQLSTPDISPAEQHKIWYSEIRSKVWERILHEDHLPPSVEALELHWLRAVWVADYWQQACNKTMSLLPLNWCGWKESNDNEVRIEWDTEDNLKKVRNCVAFLTKGCACKTGCQTKRCRCVKDQHPCGPGCTCNKSNQKCHNIQDTGTVYT